MDITAIDLKLLRCFEVLMAERNVSRAAARLDLSQPAMSSALARLRAIFDNALLVRSKGEMLPTVRALELAAEVRGILEAAERLVRRPSAFDPAATRARFSIMAAEPVEYLLATRLMERLGQAPGIDVDFVPADRQRAQGLLERGEIDFRLGWWPNPAPMLRYKMLFRDRLVCLVRKGHPAIHGRMTAEQFLVAPHVRFRTTDGGPSGQVVDDAAALLRGKIRVALRIHGVLSLSHVVSHSDLIATAPESLARRLARDHPLQVLPLPLAVPDLRIALYWHERTHKQAGHRWFRQLLTDVAKELQAAT
jgi:DNA-binding transcriptional LysR family regulator